MKLKLAPILIVCTWFYPSCQMNHLCRPSNRIGGGATMTIQFELCGIEFLPALSFSILRSPLYAERCNETLDCDSVVAMISASDSSGGRIVQGTGYITINCTCSSDQVSVVVMCAEISVQDFLQIRRSPMSVRCVRNTIRDVVHLSIKARYSGSFFANNSPRSTATLTPERLIPNCLPTSAPL